MKRLFTSCLSFALLLALALLLANSRHPAYAQGAKAESGAPSEPLPKQTAPDVKGSLTHPRVFFITPKDGETVKPEFVAKFGIEGMQVHKASEVVPGTGHHHLIINGGPIPKGEAVPKDEKHIHFGDGSTETKLKLAPGEYTLTLQFADGTHMSYGEELSQTIKIKVKK